MKPEDVGKRYHQSQKYVLDDQTRYLMMCVYDGRSDTLDMLQKRLPGVPRKKICQWASQLGLTQPQRDWTSEEDRYLTVHYSLMSIQDIANKLDRSKHAVEMRVLRLGISRTEEGYTLGDLQTAFGCSPQTIRQWIKAGWLAGRKRKTTQPDPQHAIWYFSDSSIRKFILNHPFDIPHRVDIAWLIDIITEHGLSELVEPQIDKKAM